MCQVLVTYNCGHRRRKKVYCDRSRSKGGIGNYLRYAFLEKPCDYDSPKRRHRLCDACESQLDGLRDYKTSRDLHRGDSHHGRRSHHDDVERQDDDSHGHREHRHREHRDKKRSEKHSSPKTSRKESHSSRSSRHRSKKSSREESRGRSTHPREPMATIDESAPLPAQPVDVGGGRPASPLTGSGPSLRDDGSSVNDFREFIRAAERAEAEQSGAQGLPSSREALRPLDADVPDNLGDVPRPPSSVYVPARANWQTQHRQQSTSYPSPRPSSSVYSQYSRAAPSSHPPRHGPKQTNSPPLPNGSAYSLPSWNAPSTRHSLQTPKQDSNPPPVPAIPAKFAASQVSVQESWVTDYVNSDEDEDGDGCGRSTLPTSKNTTPHKSVEPPPRPAFRADPWTQDPFDRQAKKWTAEAREKLREQEAAEQAREQGSPIGRGTSSRNSAHASYGGEYPQSAESSNTNPLKDSDHRPLNADNPNRDEPQPMMHFTCYRDPNDPRPPPAPTPSSTGSRVYMNPRQAPAPPGPSGGLPQPNSGFNAHRLSRQSIDNISHVTRWSELCPPNVNSNIKTQANAEIKATHNGKPVHVVDPNIVKRSWGSAEGPSAGKISHRASGSKNSGSNVKQWFSKLRPEPSEASFGCVDVKKHDSLHSQERPDSKRSNRSNNSKKKKKF